MKKVHQSNNKTENTEGLSNNNGTVSGTVLSSYTYQIKSLAQIQEQLSKFYNYETVILGQASEKSDADLANAKLGEEI
ncbi:hypothetical protein Trichorick_01350 [Candidatus Trichorickettsia mobilis]|uniref:Uncharacterized protein n=1 Tax=Candidatus Trichorickettsia mobilis TaxID=1346319 RepID=A0ABZ0UWG7_9RICK|nr:hypothetical protein [Candidatus Trichorickettsia mobilis]WPY01437.1 hypothetical protein Trichorick_01350 [Candidatus Trichorickettsia mobilis]